MTPLIRIPSESPVTAVDHFAGIGWGVACHRLGIREYGVDINPTVIRTRTANGMRTIYRNVWAGLLNPGLVPAHRLYKSSPPCQTFSMSGGGEGRQALEDVYQAIDDERWKSASRLLELNEKMDERTALVLTPLAHIFQHRPELVALEQVPPVLPVWRRIASVLRTLGYSAWSGLIRSEQYGVPQTRERAILLARLDGPVKPPSPTHSRYYPSHPERLDEGVAPWVSMAEALGWDANELVGFPRLGDGREVVEIDGVEYRERDLRPASGPALNVTGKARSWERFTAERGFLGAGRQAGEMVGQRVRPIAEPAHTITGSGTAACVFNRPATTIAGDSRVWAPGHKVNASDLERRSDARERYGDRAGSTAIRVTLEEAAALQSFPPDFVWRGTQTARFQMVGNAVPPLMAEAILASLIAEPAELSAWDNVFAEVAG
ncbi:DNA cytosine methyltransferase [Microbacterium lacus]|uniref:DNA cytosine methyltransferase n=1 Tax=Microbacterium lacus TaxID=415217 RepID=UPI000C2C63EF|nr:DNA cytosine methyltransferase [Microbacterium lacus]